jgi:hypothetical protein
MCWQPCLRYGVLPYQKVYEAISCGQIEMIKEIESGVLAGRWQEHMKILRKTKWVDKKAANHNRNEDGEQYCDDHFDGQWNLGGGRFKPLGALRTQTTAQ